MVLPLTRIIAVSAAYQLLAGEALALTPVSDNFNASKLDGSRWKIENYGKGKLVHKSGRIQFTVANPPTGDDYAILDLRSSQPGFNESWQVILDVTNTQGAGKKAAPGIWIYNADDDLDGVFFEFYGKKGGFNTIFVTDDQDNAKKDIAKNPKVNSGSMRITFDKNTKLFTFWYDKDGPKKGYKWTKVCTFSPTGKGGDRSGDWKMNPGGGRFGIRLFGYAERQAFGTGKITLDNFALKGMK